MACLVPRMIVNPHYKKISPDRHFYLYHKDHGLYPKKDYYLQVGCGRCINCFKKYMSAWRFRLLYEYYGLTPSERDLSYYVTLTIEPKFYTENFVILKKMVRRFLDRCRKKFGHSIRHFLVTERGEDTNRYHFHGFFFNTTIPPNLFYQLWYYGFVSIYRLGSRNYTVEQEISYCTTYITKGKKGALPTIIPPDMKPLVLVSPGIGKYYSKVNSSFHQSQMFTQAFSFDGSLRSLPRYLRQKVFTEDQLKMLKDTYFDSVDWDAIPEPPYYIGERCYNDYREYLRDCKLIKSKYIKIYGK